MLVSHRHRFIALKTHAAASTALEQFLEPCCLPEGSTPASGNRRPEQVTPAGIIGARGMAEATTTWVAHMPAALVRARLGEEAWHDYLKFCVVQHPLDREVTWFWSRLPAEERQALETLPFGLVRDRFGQYLGSGRTMPDDAPLYCIAGHFALDAALRQERLEDDLAALCGRLGIAFAPDRLVPWRNSRRTRPEPWPDYYTPVTRQATLARHGAACRRFGYR